MYLRGLPLRTSMSPHLRRHYDRRLIGRPRLEDGHQLRVTRERSHCLDNGHSTFLYRRRLSRDLGKLKFVGPAPTQQIEKEFLVFLAWTACAGRRDRVP